MTVGREYLMKKPPRPSAAKVFFDRRFIPRAVNITGSAEAALDRVATRTSIRPLLILSYSAAMMSLIAVIQWRKHNTAQADKGVLSLR